MQSSSDIGGRLKVFINRVDSYLGNSLSKFFSGEEHPTIQGDVRYEIVGTIVDAEKKPRWVSKIVEREVSKIVEAIKTCSIVVYDIMNDCDEVKDVLQELEHLSFEENKLLVIVSTLMNWAKTPKTGTKDEDDETTFSEDDFRKRKPHPNFKKHLFIEKYTLRLKNEKIKSYVVAPGLVYGEGENTLHPIFKTAWLGEPKDVPYIGNGSNYIPCIHLADLSVLVYQVAHLRPDDQYILAVDDSNFTQKEIVDAVSKTLGSGSIVQISKEESLLSPIFKELSQNDLDILQLDLRTESLVARDLGFQWKAEMGIIDNIDTVVDEFKQKRKLHPLCIMVHGPPFSGKSTLCKAIASFYKIHHIISSSVISEGLEKMDPDEADDLKASMKDPNFTLPEELLVSFYREKLLSWRCQNQGFVLDGFPSTIEQAQALFAPHSDNPDGSPRDDTSPRNVRVKLLPDYVFVLDADDEFLKERIMMLPENMLEGTNNTEESFVKRMNFYKEHNAHEDDSVLGYYDSFDVLPLTLKASDSPANLLNHVKKIVGEPKGYGPSQEEKDALNKIEQEKEKVRLEKYKKDEETRQKEEEIKRKKKESEWISRLSELELQEKELLEVQSTPFRRYLMDNVMPTLTKGLVELCNVRPDDPIDYLDEYLFKNSTK
eukprot:TRINITY_DN1992_c0_g1_i1.p1 TRINITY_DN1992_c0_g1~~TRINITY_DN1992_c0_g1_i1.p1  ORF type:complete len:657 (+),score=154.73 TRINITY_DN1992_c0_g1_i1:65-2035(+)